MNENGKAPPTYRKPGDDATEDIVAVHVCTGYLRELDFQRGTCWRCHELIDLAKAKAALNGGGKARRSNKGRNLRPDDIGGMIVDVVRASKNDPRLTDVDRDVLRALDSIGHKYASNEVAATERWLEGRTGHARWRCRTALSRLERFGYLREIERDEIKLQKFASWLAGHKFEHGRLPRLFRLSLDPPKWQSVPDYDSVDVSAEEMAEFDALVSA